MPNLFGIHGIWILSAFGKYYYFILDLIVLIVNLEILYIHFLHILLTQNIESKPGAFYSLCKKGKHIEKVAYISFQSNCQLLLSKAPNFHKISAC